MYPAWVWRTPLGFPVEPLQNTPHHNSLTLSIIMCEWCATKLKYASLRPTQADDLYTVTNGSNWSLISGYILCCSGQAGDIPGGPACVVCNNTFKWTINKEHLYSTDLGQSDQPSLLQHPAPGNLFTPSLGWWSQSFSKALVHTAV